MNHGENADEGIALGLLIGIPIGIALCALGWWLTHNSGVVAVVGLLVVFGCTYVAQSRLNRKSERSF